MLISKKLDFIVKQNEVGKLSHAFLIETNNIDRCLLEIKQLIKMINCPYKYKDECDKDCNLCKLIDNDNLPSLITIRPDGMSIKRNQIEDMVINLNTKPLFSKYNSYIITNAELMNQVSSNMLLKFLEEPNDHLVGFYITNSINQILPTIKSRCEVVTVNYEKNVASNNNIIDIANNYIKEVINGNDYLINKNIILNAELDRKSIQDMFLYLFDMYKQKLEFCLQNKEDNSKVLYVINLIEKELKYLQYNVNIELILDDFVIEMRKSRE